MTRSIVSITGAQYGRLKELLLVLELGDGCSLVKHMGHEPAQQAAQRVLNFWGTRPYPSRYTDALVLLDEPWCRHFVLTGEVSLVFEEEAA